MGKKIETYFEEEVTDAGTGQRFAAGTVHEIEEGQFTNYAFTGKARKATASDKKSSGAAGAAA